MRAPALGDVFKVIIYVIASFFFAALLAPPLFELGKGFAEFALGKETAEWVAWLATKAERSEFDTYFKRALFLTAVAGLFPLFYSLRHESKRMIASGALRSENISERIRGQALRKLRSGVAFRQVVAGFILTAVFFLIMSWIIFRLGWFEWKPEPSRANLGVVMAKILLSAMVVSILEEVFFRGALLGIFLRAFRPSHAILSLSVLFAATHFLTPPENAGVADPRAAGAGFEMLGLIAGNFLQPELLIHRFLSLLLIGIILGFARFRTASLWLPIGLHTGWVFSLKLFGHLTKRRSDFPAELHLVMGKQITEGLIPIGMLALTGVALAAYLKAIGPRKVARE